jgi:DegV family protein with EDD domain
MTIKIVTDSTCDLPEATVEQLGITVLPLYINIGERSYLDGVELTRDEFYEQLPSYKVPPTTSAPGNGTFLQAYERLAQEGAQEILSIHIAESLSGVMNAAQPAAQSTEMIPVTMFDSGQISLGIGLLVKAAAAAAMAGESMQEILKMLEDLKSRTYTFAALDTLEFLRRSGRVSVLQSAMGALLSVKPLLTMHDGEIGFDKVRTRNAAIQWLIDRVTALGPLEEYALIHTHTIERLEGLQQRTQHLLPANGEPLIAEVTPVIGAHVGPGAVGFACIAKS